MAGRKSLFDRRRYNPMNDQLRTDLQKINDRLQTLQVRL